MDMGDPRHMHGSNVLFMDGHAVHINKPLEFVPLQEGWNQ